MMIRRRLFRTTQGQWLSRDPNAGESLTGAYLYCKNSPVVLIDANGEVPFAPMITWLGRALLVKAGVLAIGTGLGYGYATLQDISNAFGQMGWGQVDDSMLQAAEIEWNKNGSCIGLQGDIIAPPCVTAPVTLIAELYYWKGVWGASRWKLTMAANVDGCDVTGLRLNSRMLTNQVRLQVLKIIVTDVDVTPNTGGSPCCSCVKPCCLDVEIGG